MNCQRCGSIIEQGCGKKVKDRNGVEGIICSTCYEQLVSRFRSVESSKKVMNPIKCEMCNSVDVVKSGNFFVCQSCGTQYTVETAKKMMIGGTVDVQGTVKVDNTAFVERYLQNARRAKQKEDWPETEKYYNMVEQNDPTNIEAIFYSAFARVKQTLFEAETREK